LRRDVALVVRNMQNNIDLELKTYCDSKVVKGYVLTTDITSSTQTEFKYDTKSYNCGDVIRVIQN